LADQQGANPLLAMRGVNGHGVNPTAMAIVTGHDGSHDGRAREGDEKELITRGELFVDNEGRTIVSGFVAKNGLPKRGDRGAVSRIVEWNNGGGHGK
jgi:hypothetical protein